MSLSICDVELRVITLLIFWLGWTMIVITSAKSARRISISQVLSLSIWDPLPLKPRNSPLGGIPPRLGTPSVMYDPPENHGDEAQNCIRAAEKLNYKIIHFMLNEAQKCVHCAKELTGFPHILENPGKSWIFSLKFPGPGKSWKMSLFLESPGIYLWFKLCNRHSALCGIACVSKHTKYFC